jgi:hypothetical protein
LLQPAGQQRGHRKLEPLVFARFPTSRFELAVEPEANRCARHRALASVRNRTGSTETACRGQWTTGGVKGGMMSRPRLSVPARARARRAWGAVSNEQSRDVRAGTPGAAPARAVGRTSISAACSLGLSATSQQYFSLRTNQPLATSRNQPAVFFSQNKPAPAISHQPTE